MGSRQTRLPDIEEQRLIDAAVKRMRGTGAGSGGAGGGGGVGAGPGTLETLTDVSITPADGDLMFRSGASWIKLAIPADWAAQRYLLGINAGFPAWVPAADDVLAIGWGFNWSNNYSGS